MMNALIVSAVYKESSCGQLPIIYMNIYLRMDMDRFHIGVRKI